MSQRRKSRLSGTDSSERSSVRATSRSDRTAAAPDGEPPPDWQPPPADSFLESFAVWDRCAVDMATLAGGHELPRLAKLHLDAAGPDKRDTPATLDIWNRSLLLYEMNRCSKVLAANIKWDEEVGRFIEVGPSVVLPVNYPGWFQLVRDGDRKGLPMKTVEDVAGQKVEAFLVHQPVVGYQYSRRSSKGENLYLKVHIPAGELLSVKNVCMETVRRKGTSGGGVCCTPMVRRTLWSRKRRSVSGGRPGNAAVDEDELEEELFYLQCNDVMGQEVLLSFGTLGEFYEVGHRDQHCDPNAVYQLNDLVRSVAMPLNLCLLHGQPPALSPAHFTGTIKLIETYFDESIIASTIGESKQTILEFPIDSEIQLILAHNWSDLKNCDEVKQATTYCEENVDGFRNSIKVLQNALSDGDDDRRSTPGSARNRHQVAERSLPPTPRPEHHVPLPTCRKKTRSRSVPGRIKRTLLRSARVLSNSRVDEIAETPSQASRPTCKTNAGFDDPDYDVIPFYLQNMGPYRSKLRESEKNNNDPEVKSDASVPSISETLEANVIDSVDVAVDEKSSAESPDDGGYLNPVEVRKLTEDFNIYVNHDVGMPEKAKPCSPHSDRQGLVDPAYSDTLTAGRSISLDMTAVNNSVDLDVQSARSRRADGKAAAETSPDAARIEASPSYDHERLDAFLTDSVQELARRQSRGVMRHQRTVEPAGCTSTKSSSIPFMESQEQLNTFLDRIFDECGKESDTGTAKSSSSSGVQVSKRASAPAVRSLSGPHALAAVTARKQPDASSGSCANSVCGVSNTTSRGTHGVPCHECGYLTIDSGISGVYLSPHSAASDPYRHEQDSNIYRSASSISWSPPDDLTSLSVEEVGLSLRYIGMKEQVVIRFSEEQIDGKQLVELNVDLLSAGFPELNALERKKMIDFIRGWRPKKWSSFV